MYISAFVIIVVIAVVEAIFRHFIYMCKYFFIYFNIKMRKRYYVKLVLLLLTIQLVLFVLLIIKIYYCIIINNEK